MKLLIAYLLSISSIVIILMFPLHNFYIGRTSISPYLIHPIRWYAVLIGISVIIGTILVYRRRNIYGIKKSHIDSLILYGILASIVGARIYYVVFEWKLYAKHPALALDVWKGGIAIHGAIASIIVVALMYTKRHKLSFLSIGDLFAPAIVLGQAIGRWGNFINHEAFGYPTALPWKMFIPMADRPINTKKMAFYHPTFLYESLGDLTIFYILLYLEKRRPSQGTIMFTYLLLYSILRFFTEWLRTDSLMVGNIRVAQLVSIVLIGISLAFLLKARRKT